MQEIGKRAMQETGKSDAGNDKKQVRWRIANPEEAQTQGQRLRYYRDTVHRMSQEELGNRIGMNGSQISRGGDLGPGRCRLSEASRRERLGPFAAAV